MTSADGGAEAEPRGQGHPAAEGRASIRKLLFAGSGFLKRFRQCGFWKSLHKISRTNSQFNII